MSSYPWIDANFLVELERAGLLSPTFVRLEEGRRDKVIGALLEEAAVAGPAAMGIKEVARRAEVPVGSLYQYFGDRDKMARCTAVLVSRKLSGELLACLPYLEPLPLREALLSYLSYGIEWGGKEAASLQSFVAAAYGGAARGSAFAARSSASEAEATVGPSAPDEAEDWERRELVRPVASAIQELVRAIVGAAAERGELAPGLDPEIATRLVGALLIAVGDAAMMPRLDDYYRLYDERLERGRAAELAVDFCCRAILRKELQP